MTLLAGLKYLKFAKYAGKTEIPYYYLSPDYPYFKSPKQRTLNKERKDNNCMQEFVPLELKNCTLQYNNPSWVNT